MPESARTRVPAAWKTAIEETLAKNPNLETWHGHFKHRLPELEEIEAHWPSRPVRDALEIGCGNGMAAVYFSGVVEKIVASDLPSVDPQAHAIGLEFARSFILLMGINNVDILGCSAENIPRGNDSFDLVYGIYCLEHIPDRAAAIKEVGRVLRNGGEALFTVPGSAWAILGPIGFYRELAGRILKRLRKKLIPGPLDLAPSQSPAKVVSASSFFRHYPHFPFPEPHGHYSSWPEEVCQYRASNWKKLVEGAGLTNVEVIPLSFVPPLLRPLLPAKLHAWIEARLKNHEAMKRFAQFYCIRAKAPNRQEV